MRDRNEQHLGAIRTECTALTPTPPGPGTQEVRFATVMTGGVSLAVWMGGVARELNLLEQASRRRVLTTGTGPAPAPPGTGADDGAAELLDLYGRLLELLDLTVDVDVLSGTSAGGINGAFLGFARARGLDIGSLRKVWLDTGSFDELLRDPTQKDPPSLLQGDGVLLDGLDAGLVELANGSKAPVGSPHPADRPPTQVFITTTLLTGETSRFSDSFGTLVQDVDHRGLFAFDADQLADDARLTALALAARCSASFPAAFEPAFIPIGPPVPGHPLDDTHPEMQDYANTTRPHFAADGGLLMNRPINPLLQTIFYRTASRQVRRVLLYVVPSPGDAPDPTATPVQEFFDEPYTLVKGLLKDLGAALHQSINADLRALRDHNDRVEAMGDARLRVAEIGAACTPPLLLQAALDDYNYRQSDALARTVVAALMRGVTTMRTDDMPESWKTSLAEGGVAEQKCRAAARAAMQTGWPSAVPDAWDLESVVAFGRSPYDGAKATVLAMLRAGWVLARNLEDERIPLSEAAAAVHDSLPPPESPHLTELVDQELHNIGPKSDEALDELAGRIAGHVAANAPNLVGLLRDGWLALADALRRRAVPILVRLANSRVDRSDPDRAHRDAAAAELRTYLAYLGEETVDGQTPEEDKDPIFSDTISRLFQLHVVVRSMLPVTAEVDQPVELVQVSADTTTLLAPKLSTAADKLTGIQLNHFGAFYKSSWRANDWMWGRLDGAGWLVHVLLDPRRIRVLADAAGADSRGTWLVDRLTEQFPELATEDTVPSEVTDELASLDDTNADILPRSLPKTARWVATAWQRHIALAELPVVAREIIVNPSIHPSPWATKVLTLANSQESIAVAAQASTRALMNGHWSEEQRKFRKWAHDHPPGVSTGDEQMLLEKLPDCPVPREKLLDEFGEPLFTRTVTKATAVAAAVTSSAKELPVVVRPAFASVRSATLIAYRLAVVTRGWPRRVFFAGAAATALGILVAVVFGSVVGIAGGALAAAGIYLMLLVGVRAVTGWGWVLWCVLLALVGAAFFVMWAWHSWLFGKGNRSDFGVIGNHLLSWLNVTVLPWLRDDWWNTALVFAILLAIFAGIIYAVVRLFRHS